MGPKRTRAVVAAALGGLFVAACGARTGLRADLPEEEPVPVADAGVDAPKDAPKDTPDAPVDAFMEADAPGIKVDCTDPSVTYVYTISNDYQLYAFNPQSGAYTKIGEIACPAPPSATPFSMAVNRKGTAFILHTDGVIYKVSTKTAKCEKTSFAAGQLGFEQFGMGFATIEQGPEEELFVAATLDAFGQSGLSALGKVDTNSFVLSKVGDFKPKQKGAELTGTGDGRLFGFVANQGGFGTRIIQIKKTDASIIAEINLPDVELGSGWAFAAWGGDFYMFTTPDGGPRVTKYEVKTGKTQVIAELPSSVVGAGVSTCAPDE